MNLIIIMLKTNLLKNVVLIYYASRKLLILYPLSILYPCPKITLRYLGSAGLISIFSYISYMHSNCIFCTIWFLANAAIYFLWRIYLSGLLINKISNSFGVRVISFPSTKTCLVESSNSIPIVIFSTSSFPEPYLKYLLS